MKFNPGISLFTSGNPPRFHGSTMRRGNICARWWRAMVLLAFGWLLVGTCRADGGPAGFAIKDGDTVVFLGDSITAARGYTKIVELYTLMRYPEARVRFWNAGKGGDTASGAVSRLERDVFAHGATVVTVAFGINDIGWGTKADQEHKQKYLDGIRTIVTECQKRHVRVFICSPAVLHQDPDEGENGFLQKMADEGMALAKSLGAGTIDISRAMREVQRKVVAANAQEKDPKNITRLHVDDGIHLNDLGQLAMAWAMLKGLGAEAEVSDATIDAAAGKAVSATGCKITDVKKLADGVSFVRLDAGLPMNLGVLSALQYRFVPVPDTLNGYFITVKGLAPGRYNIRAEGRLLGAWDANQLAAGINISSATGDGWVPGGPWDAQSDAVKEVVDARDKLWMGGQIRDQYNETNPDAASLAAGYARLDERLTKLARAQAKPYPYHFEVRRAP
ncbi:MAG TPA: SGNH/GDSL hydrolase family protein [Verrucomicrobiae bacterium]|nr:SGNH/GDSL hydrolase family protein [Verrucomicrobiae bacterium]